MFRKGLALLLVLSWMIFSGIVVTEYLDLSGSYFHTSTDAPTWLTKSDAVLADDPTESAANPQLSEWELLLKEATGGVTTFALTRLQACFKLHKLHHVFII